MDRRRLLCSASAAGLILALVACTALPQVEVKMPPEMVTLADDANLIYKKLSGLALPAGAASLIDELRLAAVGIAGSKALADARGYVSTFSSLIDAIKPYLPSTGAISKIISAIDTVLPVMLRVAGLLAMFAATRPTGLTVEEARAILRS